MILVLHRCKTCNSDPPYLNNGYRFFKAYYESFGKKVNLISTKFMPETDAAVTPVLKSSCPSSQTCKPFTETKLIWSNNLVMNTVTSNLSNYDVMNLLSGDLLV